MDDEVVGTMLQSYGWVQKLVVEEGLRDRMNSRRSGGVVIESYQGLVKNCDRLVNIDLFTIRRLRRSHEQISRVQSSNIEWAVGVTSLKLSSCRREHDQRARSIDEVARRESSRYRCRARGLNALRSLYHPINLSKWFSGSVDWSYHPNVPLASIGQEKKHVQVTRRGKKWIILFGSSVLASPRLA